MWNEVLSAIVTLVLALLAWGLKEGASYIRAKTAGVKGGEILGYVKLAVQAAEALAPAMGWNSLAKKQYAASLICKYTGMDSVEAEAFIESAVLDMKNAWGEISSNVPPKLDATVTP